MKHDFILVRDEGNEPWAYKLCDQVVKISEDKFTARPLIWVYDVPEREKALNPNYEEDPKMSRFNLIGWFMKSQEESTEIGGRKMIFRYENSAPEFLEEIIKMYENLNKKLKNNGCKRVPEYMINGQII